MKEVKAVVHPADGVQHYSGDTHIDLTGLSPMLRGDKLILDMPSVSLPFGALTESMQSLGLTEPQISMVLDKCAREIRIAVLSNLLAERMD